MLTLADVFREYGPEYLRCYGDTMLPSHRQVIQDIIECRTAVMGGEVFWCDACEDDLYAYHSCGNRHCPTCGADRADHWRDKHLEKLLPIPYFLVTFTLPHSLNPIAHANQKLVYRLLFQASENAMKTVALNPTWLGGQIGMVGALHTWMRHMGYHVHVHSLVPAGGIDPQTGDWKPSHPTFLVPGSALSDVLRAKFRDALKVEAPDLFALAPPTTWTKTWGGHCKAVGDGRTALKYLTPYIYRVAISNSRMVSMDDGTVTFSYKPRKKAWTTMTLPAMQFMQRFLQHVLPKGFQKVRAVGFLHPSAKKRFMALKEQLDVQASTQVESTSRVEDDESDETASRRHTPDAPGVCPHCGAPLRYLGRLPRWPAITRPLPEQRGPPHTDGGAG